MSTFALNKIKAIDQKIVTLKEQQGKLQQSLELKIINLLKAEKALSWDFEILYGAIYELTQRLQNAILHNSDLAHCDALEITKWQQLGAERLGKIKNKTAIPKATNKKSANAQVT